MFAPIAALTLTGILGLNSKALLRLYQGSDQAATKAGASGDQSEMQHDIVANRVFNGRGHPLPKSRSRIKAGDLVLAIDDDEIGWFEAVVIEAPTGSYVLRWRDHPEEGPFVRRPEQIALMHDPDRD